MRPLTTFTQYDSHIIDAITPIRYHSIKLKLNRSRMIIAIISIIIIRRLFSVITKQKRRECENISQENKSKNRSSGKNNFTSNIRRRKDVFPEGKHFHMIQKAKLLQLLLCTLTKSKFTSSFFPCQNCHACNKLIAGKFRVCFQGKIPGKTLF